ncbi:hypothetical protein Brms1b_011253 [Colletotrichum noveboracense]|nr:hypothetical protein Brms1b_011253 [Colletotrichum noveboracense]
MDSFYESLNCRPLGKLGDTSLNKTPPRGPHFRAQVPVPRFSEPEPGPEPESAPEREPEPDRETREPQQRPNDTDLLPPSPPPPPNTASLLTVLWKICVNICVSGPWKICVIIYVWGPWICYGGIILSALALVAWFFRKLGPIIFFVVENVSWLLAVSSAATARTFSALPALPALPSWFSSTPSSAPNMSGLSGVRLTDNSTRVLQVPLVLGVVISGTGVSFEVSTSHATFLIDTLSDELFGQEKPMLTFEVQKVKVSGSWNSAQNQWVNTKRTWETEMAGFFFNVSWESNQLADLADMWDKTDEQAARDSLEQNSASTAAAILLKVRRYLQGAEPGKTRPRSVKVVHSVGRLRGAVEQQVDSINRSAKIHGHMSESRSVSCGAGNFLQSGQQTGQTTGVNVVSDGVSLIQASDSMYAFCKIMETCLVEIDALMSKASEDVDLLQKVGWKLSKGWDSLVISMAAKSDKLVQDGDEHAESERLMRNNVVKIVRDVKDQISGYFAVQYDL